MPPPKSVARDIQSRFVKNFGQEQHYQGPFLIPDNINGLIPYINPTEMLKILRLKEKLLCLEMWKDEWEQKRLPVKKWYELKDKRFSNENRRHRLFLDDEKMQEDEYQMRMGMFEFYRLLKNDDI
jgi:hypothetical protein